jgi:hypothetical protein
VHWRKIAPIVFDDANVSKPHAQTLACCINAALYQSAADFLRQVRQQVFRERDTAQRLWRLGPNSHEPNALLCFFPVNFESLAAPNAGSRKEADDKLIVFRSACADWPGSPSYRHR